jgi:hypothetical protein
MCEKENSENKLEALNYLKKSCIIFFFCFYMISSLVHVQVQIEQSLTSQVTFILVCSKLHVFVITRDMWLETLELE